jgi:uncharacterized membrane protein (DUF4010 family)
LLIGLERERRPEAKAGVRTFSLIALVGTLAALIAEETSSPWFLVAAAVLIGASLVAAYVLDPQASPDLGTTTVIAALFCYALGAILWYGHYGLALGLSIVGVALLHFKTELEGFSHKLTPRDVVSTVQFAALWFVVLPLLPDASFGPYGALNPAHIWLMVVLISGISWAGYVAWRMLGDRYGLAIIGLLGGLVSSTATTLVFARATARDPQALPASVVIIAAASLVISLRLAVVTATVAPTALPTLSGVLVGALVGGLPIALYWWMRDRRAAATTSPEFTNPASLRIALAFGVGYALVLLFAAWLADVAGTRGLYPFAFVSGLTDVDAITLSSLRLFQTNAISAQQAASAIAIALLGNLALKTVFVFVIGGYRLGMRVSGVFAGSAAGIAVALALLQRALVRV